MSDVVRTPEELADLERQLAEMQVASPPDGGSAVVPTALLSGGLREIGREVDTFGTLPPTATAALGCGNWWENNPTEPRQTEFDGSDGLF